MAICNRILVVEDEAPIRWMISEALRDAGFDVVEACTGDEAWKLISVSAGIHAVFTDVRMPGVLDGIDLASQIVEQSPQMPVVITSGYAHQMTPRLNQISPVPEFIPKPYSIARVIETFGRLMPAG